MVLQGQGHRNDSGDSPGQDLTMPLGGINGYSNQAPRVPSSASLLCAHIPLPLFLFRLPLAHLSGAQSLWVSGVLLGVVSEVPCPCRVAPGGSGFGHGLEIVFERIGLIQMCRTWSK